MPDDIAEVIRILNAIAYGLSSGIRTTRLDHIQGFVAERDFGTVNIREVPGHRTGMSPFGDMGDSGPGCKECVGDAMKSFTNAKIRSMPWPA